MPYDVATRELSGLPRGCAGADLDGVGDVDLADVLLFQAAFTGAR